MADKKEMLRVERTRQEARASYDKISKWYDMLTGFEKKYRNAALQKLGVKEGETVLEIGFGTGHCILSMAQSVGDSGKVYGIDISDKMRDIARSRIEKAGLSDRVELRCGDAVKLPFEGKFFDAIFMSFTLELFDTPEIPLVLHECYRTLLSGGRICVLALSKTEKVSTMLRLFEWAHKKLPKFLDCRPIYVRQSLEDIGFQTFHVTEMSMLGLPIEIAVAKKV